MAVAAMAQENDDPDLASSLSHAIELRSSYLRGQAQTITMTKVRRLLERDLKLKNLHLDAHKNLVQILVDKVLIGAPNDAEDESVVTEKPKQKRKKRSRAGEDLQDGDHETGRTNGGNSDNKRKLLKNVNTDQEKPPEIGEEESEDHGNLLENLQGAEEPESPGNAAERPTNGDEELFEKQGDADEGPNNVDKEILEKELDAQENLAEGIEEALEKGNVLLDDTEEKPDEVEPPKVDLGTVDENAIKSALLKRADELKSQAESLSVRSVIRLLAEDLGLEPDGLDVHKQFIRRLVDDELLRGANEEPIIDPSNLGKVKKEGAPVTGEGKLKKKKDVKSALGKRRVLDEETEESEEKFQGSGEVSDSASEERRPVKVRKKKTSEAKTKPMVVKKSVEVKRPFSANVERLREILKAVGLGVSPIVYKKAKQAPEHERDEVLIKELENRLSQEGLSSNPTEKEIKRVKTRLEKKRDLDGIEHSNIVAEPRRSRAAANSWFAPRQNKYSQVGEVGNKDSEEQDSDDDPKPMVTGAMDD